MTPRSLIVSSAVNGSKRCTSTTVAPRARLMPSTTLSPKMWNTGSTPYTTSSPTMPSVDRPCSMLASRLPWLSIAARGEPAVPLVKMSTATSCWSTSTAGVVGSPASRSSNAMSAASEPVSVATTTCTVGTLARSTWAQAWAADGSTTTILALTVCSSRSISGAGLAGLSGTTTAPRPTAARYRSTK